MQSIDQEICSLNRKVQVVYTGVFSLETQPSGKLPEDIFEETSKLLIKIARNIVDCCKNF